MSSTEFFLRVTFNKAEEAETVYQALEHYRERQSWEPYINETVLENAIKCLEAVNIPGRHLLTEMDYYFAIMGVELNERVVDIGVTTVKHRGFGVFFQFFKDFLFADTKNIVGHAEHDFDGQLAFLYSEGDDIYQLWCTPYDHAFKKVFPEGFSFSEIATQAQDGKFKVVPTRSKEEYIKDSEANYDDEFFKKHFPGKDITIKLSYDFDYLNPAEQSFCLYE